VLLQGIPSSGHTPRIESLAAQVVQLIISFFHDSINFIPVLLTHSLQVIECTVDIPLRTRNDRCVTQRRLP
jgi:hypothetical protein